MNVRARNGVAVLASVSAGLVLLLPSGSAGTAAGGACIGKRCIYDVKFELTVDGPTLRPGQGPVFRHELTARFPRVPITHTQNTQNPLNFHSSPTPNSASASPASASPGTVSALVEINSPAPCAHKKRYTANAFMTLGGGVDRRGQGTLGVELAPRRVVPPGWINCPSYEGQPLEAGAHGALRMAPGESRVRWGDDSFVGKASLSVFYAYSRKAGTAQSPSQPFRGLWAGKNAVLTDRGQDLFAPTYTAEVRMTFTRRS